jgi:hypothetical protein
VRERRDCDAPFLPSHIYEPWWFVVKEPSVHDGLSPLGATSTSGYKIDIFSADPNILRWAARADGFRQYLHSREPIDTPGFRLRTEHLPCRVAQRFPMGNSQLRCLQTSIGSSETKASRPHPAHRSVKLRLVIYVYRASDCTHTGIQVVTKCVNIIVRIS